MNVVSALDAGRWSWDGERREDEHLGRACVALSGDGVAAVVGAELEDGVVEADLALTGGRGFHGLVWRLRGLDYESFYVRPHQNGNPDAIQYTPVFNDVAAWQLHHGERFWNEVRFPARGGCTICVAFAGEAAAVALDGREVLHTRLRHPPRAGGLGLLVAGEAARLRAALGGWRLRRAGPGHARRSSCSSRMGHLATVRRGRRAQMCSPPAA